MTGAQRVKPHERLWSNQAVATEGQSPDLVLLKDLSPGQAFYLNMTDVSSSLMKTLVWNFESMYTLWDGELATRRCVGFIADGVLHQCFLSDHVEVFLLW